MKASRFNRVFKTTEGAWLAFNSYSTALAELDPENVSFIQALLASPNGVSCRTPEQHAIREALIEGHFLVEDEIDELAQVQADVLRDRFRQDHLLLTIAPTLDCNFRCDYCYEEHLRVTMAKAVQKKLVEWVRERAPGTRKLSVCWYGGEPLLPRALAVVENLSAAFVKIAQEHGIEYEAQVITNGFLLDREKMKRLVELGVQSVQVTLDGPPDMHDRRRVLINGRGTFWRIIENLKETVDLASFQLRINVDQRNAMAALDLVEVLVEEGLGDKIRPYLAQVTYDGAACGNILEACYSSDDFARMEVQIYEEAGRRDLPLARYPSRIPGAFCTADRVNGFVFSPTGSIFKCWHEVTMNPDAAIATLLDGQQPFQKANEDRWLSWNAFEKQGCRSCNVLPLCHGGCPLEAIKHPEKDRGACERYKFNLEPLLGVTHRHGSPYTRAAGESAARDFCG